LKGYSAKRLIKEFATDCWKNDFVKQLKDNGLAERKAGSGRQVQCALTRTLNLFDEFVLSQEDALQSYNIVI